VKASQDDGEVDAHLDLSLRLRHLCGEWIHYRDVFSPRSALDAGSFRWLSRDVGVRTDLRNFLRGVGLLFDLLLGAASPVPSPSQSLPLDAADGSALKARIFPIPGDPGASGW
jgi:hypothetical protein